MANKAKETVIDKEVCVHYWIIATGISKKSSGKCKKCGVIRTFLNSIPDTIYTSKQLWNSAI